MNNKKDFSKNIARYAIKLFIFIAIIAASFIPLAEIFAFDPDYPDFIWTYSVRTRKISAGTQKAVYLTGYSMASEEKRQDIYRLIEETELNSIVFNAKEDSGEIFYNSGVKFFNEIGAVNAYYDIDKVLQEMDERNIYSIARIVLFKDGIITDARPDLAIQNNSTGARIYLDGGYWVDIFNRQIWDYYIELIMELTYKGIDEIQFDYIRAPSRGNISMAMYPSNTEEMEKVWAIKGFLKAVREATKNYPVKISADVFGFVFITENDQGIGQLIEEMVWQG